jgi:PAS domain S-box-containing protein
MTKKSLLIAAKNYLKRMAGLDVPVYDVELKKKSGERVAIQINAMAIRKDKKITGDLAILRNITEIKQAEKNLKLQKDLIDRILATIPNAVLLLNRNLQVIMANKAFYKLFKLKKNLVENKPIEEIIVTTDLDQAILTIANGKEKNVSTEFRYSVASSEKTLLTNIFSMEEKNILLVINDITEERQRQERLYLTDRLASVGEMASGVAHELNNPLTSIIGLSELLTKQNMPNEAKEDLTAIHSEAQRCAKIVKNLLTFARKHNVSREPVQITEVVKEVLKLRSYEHRANNISTETRFPPDLPKVLADYFQMQQVFLNIILNAETAMFDANGRGTLKITGEAANNHVSISFADDGPGISKENMRLLFNPFFTTKEVGKGTGLGLSICYGIVASHGGRIYAESEYGKGATFTVELPALEY